MKTVTGDLIDLALKGEFDVICHGANCFCTMGGGIARQIKKIFPAAFDADCETKEGDKSKLGTCTYAECETVTVVNAYTQFSFGGGEVNVDYDAVRSCMQWIAGWYTGMRIGLPRIGAGLAGGDWDTIRDIIEQELDGEDVTIVEWDQ